MTIDYIFCLEIDIKHTITELRPEFYAKYFLNNQAFDGFET